MKKLKVMSKDDESFNDVMEWAEIHHDDNGYDPFSDCEQVFELWSNIPREIGSTKGAEDPLEEIEDEDGYGTGRYQPKEGYIVVPVSVMIHSGIYFSLGTVRCMFGDTPVCPGGRGWDTTPNACFLYTYKELWERMMGKDTWMKVRVHPESDDDWSRRPATQEEFEEEVERVAGYLVDELNLAEQGSVYGYTTHKRVHYTRIDDDGTKTDCWEVEDGDDSCWGFLTDKVADIDFPRDLPVYVGSDCQWFEGDEYEVREYLVTMRDENGVRAFLKDYKADKDGKCLSAEWRYDKSEARKYISRWQAMAVATAVTPDGEHGEKASCVEIDDVEKLDKPDKPEKGNESDVSLACPEDGEKKAV